MNISILESDIVTRLNNICELITEEDDFKITLLALQAIPSLKVSEYIQKIELKDRIENFINFYNEEPEVLGIQQDEKIKFQTCIKHHLVLRLTKLASILEDPGKKEHYMDQNQRIQKLYALNRLALKSSNPQNKTTLSPYESALSLIHGSDNFEPLSQLSFCEIGDLSSSFLLQNSYISKNDIENLSLREFIFLEDPEYSELINICLEKESKPLSLEQINLFVKKLARLILNCQLCASVKMKKITYLEALNLPESTLIYVYHLHSLIIAGKIDIKFINENPRFCQFLKKNSNVCLLIKNTSIDIEVFTQLTNFELKLAADFYFDFIIDELFFSMSVKEMQSCLNQLFKLSDFQIYKNIKEDFLEKNNNIELRNLINRSPIEYSIVQFIHLLKIGRVVESDLEGISFTALSIITEPNIFELIKAGKLSFKRALVLTYFETETLLEPLPYLLLFHDAVELDNLFTISVDNYRLFLKKDFAFILFYLQKSLISLEDLTDINFLELICCCDFMNLMKNDYDFNMVLNWNDVQRRNVVLLSKLINKNIIDIDFAINLPRLNIILNPTLIKLIEFSFISIKELRRLGIYEIGQIKQAEVNQLIFTREVELHTAIELEWLATQNIIYCKNLIHKGLMNLENATYLNFEFSELLRYSTILQLIEKGDLNISEMPDVNHLKLLTDSVLGSLIISNYLTIERLSQLDTVQIGFLKDKIRADLILMNVITVEEALIFEADHIIKLNEPLIGELILKNILSAKDIGKITDDQFEWLKNDKINHLIEIGGLSFDDFLSLSDYNISNLACFNISSLIKEGYLTLKDALKLDCEDIERLESLEIYNLIQLGKITIEQIQNLKNKEIRNLNIPGISLLIGSGILDVAYVLDLTPIQLTCLNDKSITCLLHCGKITLNDVYGMTNELREFCKHAHFLFLLREGYFTFDRLNKILLNDNAGRLNNLKNRFIFELLRAKKISLRRALSLSEEQISLLSNKKVFDLIFYKKYSVQKALKASS